MLNFFPSDDTYRDNNILDWEYEYYDDCDCYDDYCHCYDCDQLCILIKNKKQQKLILIFSGYGCGFLHWDM